MLEKVQRAHRTQQIFSGTKHGREFYRDSMGACIPKTYPKSTQNGPKTYPGDITVTPKNIFEIKNQNFYFVLMLIPSGDSHNDKLATNG
jgi:hypothetical protein